MAKKPQEQPEQKSEIDQLIEFRENSVLKPMLQELEVLQRTIAIETSYRDYLVNQKNFEKDIAALRAEKK